MGPWRRRSSHCLTTPEKGDGQAGKLDRGGHSLSSPAFWAQLMAIWDGTGAGPSGALTASVLSPALFPGEPRDFPKENIKTDADARCCVHQCHPSAGNGLFSLHDFIIFAAVMGYLKYTGFDRK